jgi:hypothetical protein
MVATEFEMEAILLVGQGTWRKGQCRWIGLGHNRRRPAPMTHTTSSRLVAATRGQ